MLKKYVAVYVPSTNDGNNPQSPQEHLESVRDVTSRLSVSFGGCTITKGEGAWVSDTHGLIVESVTICKSYHDGGTDALSIAESIARDIKARHGQEAVTIETEEGIEFI